MSTEKPTERTPLNLDIPLPECAWVGPLLTYRELVCTESEVPESYHWAAAVTVIGQLFGRRVYGWYAQYLYLNFFFLLIGGTGTRKSTAINCALEMRGDAPGGELIGELHGAASGEGIVKHLAEARNGQLIIVEHELAGLIKKAQGQSGGNFLHTLCKLHDAPRTMQVGTKNNPVVVERPMGSLLCAATPESLEDCITDTEVYGGLLNRIIPIAGAPRPPQPWPSRPDESLWQAMIHEIEEAVSRYQHPTMLHMKDPAARARWEAFYRGYTEEQNRSHDGVAALRNRLHTHVYRLATFYAALRGGQDITEADLLIALALGEYIEAIISGQMGLLSSGRERMIEDKIKRALWDQPRTRRQLAQAISGRVKSKELHDVLRVLLNLERVAEVRESGHLAWADAPYAERLFTGTGEAR